MTVCGIAGDKQASITITVSLHEAEIPEAYVFELRLKIDAYCATHQLAKVEVFDHRVPKNVVMVDTYTAFGSDPVPIAWSEALTAAQTGTVDGGDLPIDVMYSQKFHDVAKHVAMTGHFVLAPPFFVSDKFMKKLSDDQKAALEMAAKIATAASRHHTNYGMGLVQKKMEGLGVKFTQPELGPWIEKAKSVHDAFAKKRDGDYAKLMEAIAAEAN